MPFWKINNIKLYYENYGIKTSSLDISAWMSNIDL